MQLIIILIIDQYVENYLDQLIKLKIWKESQNLILLPNKMTIKYSERCWRRTIGHFKASKVL